MSQVTIRWIALVLLAAAILAVAVMVAGCGVDTTKKPKDSFVDRVRVVCGEEIARDYANVRWRDRDYAQDSLLVSCIVFKERTP